MLVLVDDVVEEVVVVEVEVDVVEVEVEVDVVEVEVVVGETPVAHNSWPSEFTTVPTGQGVRPPIPK